MDANVSQAVTIRNFLYNGSAYGESRRNRLAALQFGFPSATDVDRLPQNTTEKTWTDGVAYYRLLPFTPNLNGRRGKSSKARFQVQCPVCLKWFSVGKFMLHVPIHTKEG